MRYYSDYMATNEQIFWGSSTPAAEPPYITIAKYILLTELVIWLFLSNYVLPRSQITKDLSSCKHKNT
ncbi:hypothetical protein CSC2_41550 [Clostridium zeae]|uniref:Uncharacterized protein n=1 Tax=Clostridium zeae TaxID=2759022 RepID=A0ABQ1EG49_9CLOT|nr:hypothetical protein CSC2_41550 [Clostridium zeae]